MDIETMCEMWNETTLPENLKGIVQEKDYYQKDPFTKTSDNGKLIIVEGPDMMGKSSFCNMLERKLETDFKKKSPQIFGLRQPEKTSTLGKTLYNAVIEDGAELDIFTEYLLFATNRSYHWNHTVLPLLKDGATVVLDRSWPSTLIYNSVIKGNDWDHVFKTEMIACKKRRPDLMILLYSSESTDPFNSLKNRVEKNRLDLVGEETRKKIRDGYLCLPYLFKFNFPIIKLDVSKESDFEKFYNENLLDEFKKLFSISI